MRHHGWQLPHHPLQVVAIAILFALVCAFYVFFVPFVGSRFLQLLFIGSYSPTVAIVFVLYVWCVATNPADVGVILSAKARKNKSASSVTSGKDATGESQATDRPQSVRSVNQKAEEAGSKNYDKKQLCNFSLCWASSVRGTSSVGLCIHKSEKDVPPVEDGMLYCSLCKVQISKYSKHCRVCDKCVDGFDHHCRWLNNCVGKKNYMGFVILMLSTVLMLIMQWAVGIWVLVHCLLDLRRFESAIGLKLGSSFSCVAYILVVAVCTILAMVATYPLAHLFCFHILLIKKGISTYDYIVTMRERGHSNIGGENIQTPLTSPTDSVATVNSDASSPGSGLQWCTPPRIFFDDENIEPAISSSAVKNLKPKASVNINPWVLASLNTEEVVRAATLARNKSSILRPVAPIRESMVLGETDSSLHDSSTRDISLEFIASLGSRSLSTKRAELNLNPKDLHYPVMSSFQTGKLPLDSYETQPESSGNDSGHILNPLQMEARNVFKSSHAYSSSGIRVSSMSEGNGASSGSRSDDVPHPSVVPKDWPRNAKSESGGYDASSDESSGSRKLAAKKLAGQSPKNKFGS